MERTEIIQSLINKINAKSYLEIGVGPGNNFNNINCDHKVCVEPHPAVPVTYTLTSDQFFNQNNEFFDVIFIDGLHESDQVYRDITNSLKVLNEGGYIVCHDMSPYCEIIQRYPQAQPGEWTGDCWKAWVKFRAERLDLTMYVVDSDYGCGVISSGNQTLVELPNELTWDTLENNRKELLNLISIDEFKTLL